MYEGNRQLTVYSDLNVDTPLETPLLTGLDAVEEALLNLFDLKKYDRVLRPDILSGLEDLLFDFLSDYTGQRIISTMISCLRKHEPRVVIDRSNSSATPDYEEDAYHVTLYYSVRGMSGSFETTFTLPRLRG